MARLLPNGSVDKANPKLTYKPNQKPKPKPKPSVPTTKATSSPVVIVPSTFVFDPNGMQSDSANAFRTLYTYKTGSSLDEQPDPTQALSDASLIKKSSDTTKVLGNIIRGRVSNTSNNPEYWSPVDAVDWLNKTTGSFLGKVTPTDVALEVTGGGVGLIGNTLLRPIVSPIIESVKDAVSNAPGLPTSIKDISVKPKSSTPSIVFNQPASIGEQLRGAGSRVAEGLGKAQDVAAATPLVPAVTYGALGPIPAIASYFAADKAGVNTNLGDTQSPAASGALKATSLGKRAVANTSATDAALLVTGGGIGPLGNAAINYFAGRPGPKLGDVQTKLENIVEKPNDYIDNRPQGLKLPPGLEGKKESELTQSQLATVALFQMGAAGAAIEDITAAYEQMKAYRGAEKQNQNINTGLDSYQELYLKQQAQTNGWNVENWIGLTPPEKIFYASNNNNYVVMTMRSLVKAAAMIGMTPAGFVSIFDAAIRGAGGDSQPIRDVISSAIAPIKQAQSDSERYGVGVAFLNAFRDHPDQVIFAANTALRTAGSVAGAIGRTGKLGTKFQTFTKKGTPITIRGREATNIRYEDQVAPPVDAPYVPLGPARPGSYIDDVQATTAAKQAEADAVASLGPRTETISPLSKPVVIGFTPGNLIDNLALRYVKANIASRSNRYSGYLQKKSTNISTRRNENVAQGISIQIGQILSDAAKTAMSETLDRRASAVEADRLAFSVIFPAKIIDINNETDLTPGWVAQQFERLLGEYLDTKINENGATIRLRLEQGETNPEWQTQVTNYNNTIAYYNKLDSVNLPASTFTNFRASVKATGYVDDQLETISKILNEPDLSIVERSNYIRLMIIDPSFERLARELKKTRNDNRRLFVKAQNRVERLAADYAEKVTPSGVGKKSAPKSRKRYAEKRAELVKALQDAYEFAVRVSDDTSLDASLRSDASSAASRYLGAIDSIEKGGVGVAERATAVEEMLASIQNVSLSNEAIAGLPVEAQAAYRAAQEANAARAAQGDVVAGVEAQRAAALGEVAPLSGTQPLKAVNASAMNAAQKRVDAAVAKISEIQSRKLPSKKELAAANAELEAATDRLGRLGGVQEINTSLVEAKASLAVFDQTRNARIREVNKIINDNTPVLDIQDVTVSVDAARGLAGIKINTREGYGEFKLKQAQGEIIDDFIARMKLADGQALLHLMSTKSIENVDSNTIANFSTIIDYSKKSGIRKGRLMNSTGALFMSGQEQAYLWDRLVFDTAELYVARYWQGKVRDLVNLTCVPIRISNESIEKANARFAVESARNPNVQLRDVVQQVLKEEKENGNESTFWAANDFRLINPHDRSAELPSGKFSLGTAKAVDPNSVESMLSHYFSPMDVKNIENNEYFLMPKAVWDGFQEAIISARFRLDPKSVIGKGDRLTRVWRDFTLNLFPKTAFNNFVGSGILAWQAGASPRHFWYAFKAITGQVDKHGNAYYYPAELRQRYWDNVSNRAGSKILGYASDYPDYNVAMRFFSSWMNTFRTLNASSEDLSRVAVWYSQAHPTAMGSVGGAGIFSRMRSLNDEGIKLVEAMANNDPAWAGINEVFLQKSFEFLGDLHKGGENFAKIRVAIPFFQWYAHMAKLTFITMPLKYPGRDLALSMIADIGNDYLQQHGFLPAGFASLAGVLPARVGIPLATTTEVIGGIDQKVTIGVSTDNWYPQGTVTPFFTQPIDAIIGTISPLVATPITGIIGSLTGLLGSTQELSGDRLTRSAIDEYGNPINLNNPEAMIYWNINNAMNVVPLVSALFDLTAKSSTSIPIVRERPKYTKASALQVSNASPNVSIEEVINNWSIDNSLLFAARFFFGMNLQTVPGVGPIQVKRIMDAYNNILSDNRKSESNIQRILSSLHSRDTQ